MIGKALAKEPGERYETCGELCRAAETELGLGGPRFTRRQLVLAGSGAALAVAAAAAVPAILLTRRDRTAALPPAILPVTEDSVVRIDPAAGEATAAISVGTSPVGVAAGEGAVWIISTGDRHLSRIDPETNEVASTAALPPGESPHGVVAGEGAVWTVHAFGVLKYDPVTNTFPPLPDDVESPKDADDIVAEIGYGTDIAAGEGAVWVQHGEVLRLDPETGVVLDKVPSQSVATTPFPLIWLAVGESGVWTASQFGASHASIRRRTR